MKDAPPVPDCWDEELTRQEWSRLSPKDKARRNTASFQRKVEAMERFARHDGGDSVAASIPRNRTELRRWSVPAERLWPWSDRIVDDPAGKNGALHVRFVHAAAEIARPKPSGKRGLRRAYEERGEIIAALEQQVARLLDQNIQLRAALASRKPQNGARN